LLPPVHHIFKVEHVSSLHVLAGAGVFNDTLHYKVDLVGYFTLSADSFQVGISFHLQLFQKIGVEVFASVLEEAMGVDRIFKNTEADLALQGYRQHFHQDGHLVVKVSMFVSDLILSFVPDNLICESVLKLEFLC